MSDWLKIRVPESDVEEWKRYAGYRNLSSWVRGLCNAEVRRLKGLGQPPPPDSTLSDGPYGRPTPPARVVAVPEPLPPAEKPVTLCRHGLQNCRVCQIGVFKPPPRRYVRSRMLKPKEKKDD